MAIESKFEYYCKNCPHIDPEATTIYTNDSAYITYITCRNKNMCEDIARIIEDAVKEKYKEKNSNDKI